MYVSNSSNSAASAAAASQGSQVNRQLDRLGLPDAFGDAFGALVDIQAGNTAGAVRNLIDLQSGLTTSQFDAFNRGASVARSAFVPRCRCAGPHLANYSNTYAVHQAVGRRAQIGQQYGFKLGPFQCKGRITGRQYCGSFSRPIQLKNQQWLYQGRTYASLNDIWRDRRDGRVDGNATSHLHLPATQYVNPGIYVSVPPVSCFGASPTPWQPNALATQAIQNIIEQLFGGGVPGSPSAAANGTNGTAPASGAGAANDTSSILSSSASLEDKLLLLMSKLADHLDKQIEDQMKKIESEMAKQNGANGANGAATEKKKSGGIFGSIASAIGGAVGAIGGVAGTVFGGPIGGMLGSQLGGAVGGAISGGGVPGSPNAASGGSDSQKSNLQLLQTQLQQMLERRSQMFTLFTSIFKSLHDASMGIVRNAKA